MKDRLRDSNRPRSALHSGPRCSVGSALMSLLVFGLSVLRTVRLRGGGSFGEQCPGDAGVLGGDRDTGSVIAAALLQRERPA